VDRVNLVVRNSFLLFLYLRNTEFFAQHFPTSRPSSETENSLSPYIWAVFRLRLKHLASFLGFWFLQIMHFELRYRSADPLIGQTGALHHDHCHRLSNGFLISEQCFLSSKLLLASSPDCWVAFRRRDVLVRVGHHLVGNQRAGSFTGGDMSRQHE